VDCDVSHVRRADLATVDALARAFVNARRLGTRLVVVNAPPELRELIVLAGLGSVLFGPLGQSEEREQTVGVEEGVEPDDPPV
jgi:anti-anti-sigma regulatory factor